MAELMEGRLVQARFAGAAPAPPALSGLHVRLREGDRLVLEYVGALFELLAWLAREEPTELRIEPLGLNAIYYRYHGNTE
jgi:hypothetical protein